MCHAAVKYRIKNSGFTLLETSLALAIGSLLILLATMLFSNALKTNFIVKKTCDELENARYACFFCKEQLNHFKEVRGLLALDPRFKKFKMSSMTDVVMFTFDNLARSKFLFISHDAYKTSCLYLKETGKPRIEIARDIREMKVLYGLKCEKSFNICNYVTATQIENGSKVLGVSISLLSGSGSSKTEWQFYLTAKANNE